MKTFRSLLAACLVSLGLLTVPASALPTVTQNPILGNAVQAGTSVSLQVTVTGAATGAVTVEWYKNGVLIPNSATTPDATTGVARYLLGVLNSPADQGVYSAVATDSTGSSAPVVLSDYQYVVDRLSFSWRHPFPAPISLNGVAVAREGDFLLMGSRGYFASSMDGSGGWEQSPSFTSDGVTGYAFGNNRHVIRTGSGRFLSLAPNGSDRVTGALPTGYGSAELIFAKGIFVALGNSGTTSGKIFTSPNGIVWTERYSGTENVFEATFGNDKFAVSTSSGKILLSADGLTWDAPVLSPLSAVWMLRFAKDRFFLGGAAGELFSSPDASTWTTLDSGLTSPATKISDLAYDGTGHYVLVGDADAIRTSADGVTWSAATINTADGKSGINPASPGTTTTTNLASIAFSKGNWVIVGNNGSAHNTSVVLRSTDNGATWSKQNGAASLAQYNGIAAHDSGDANASIVAVGNGGTIVRSTDGWTWTGVTSGTGSQLNEITYSSAYFAAGNGGTVRTSTDQGLTWTALDAGLTTPTAFNLFWIGNLNGNLHVAGASGKMSRYSGTGTTSASWTAISTGSTAQLNGAAYGAPAATPSYIAVGNAVSGVGTILRSADGNTWAAVTNGAGSQNLNDVAFGEGRFVAVGNAGTILYSTDGGTSWTSSSIQTTTNFTHVTFTNGLFMVSGSESAVMVSPDGTNWKAKLTQTSAAGLIRATAAYGGRVYGVGAAGSILAADLIPQIDQVTVTENVTTGGAATFTVDYVDPLLDTTIQWTKGGFNIPGATGPTYTIPATTRADAGAYAATLTTTARATGSDPVLLAVAPTQQPGVFTADPTFNPDPLTISTRVYAGLKLSNNPNMAGKWLAGGDFVRWDNSARAGLARLNADLTLDTNYTPPVFNGFVLALAEAPDGSIYVGGDFTAVDGHLRNGLARLRPDLTLDLAWQPADGAPRSQVSALAVDGTGKVLVARNGTAITGTNVVRRLNQNGTLDGGFSVDVTLGFGRIYNLILESSGAVVIGGQFTLGTHLNIARVDSTGAVDATFAGSTGADNTVFALKRLADGRYLAGGQFANIGGSARNHAAIINDTTGALDSYTPATGFSGGSAVRGLTVLSGGDLLLGGDFTSYGGTATWGLIRLNGSTGTVVQGYSTSGTAVGFPGNGAGRNLDLFTRPDGSVAIFGGFQSVLNQRRVGVAALNVDGTLSATPNSLLYRPAYANNVIVEADGNLTLGGSIDSVGGAGGKFASVRLNPSGGVVSGYPVGTGFTPNGLSVFELYRLLRQADGKTLAVGDITGYNGTASNKLVRLSADGTADTSFAIVGSGPNTVFPGTTLLQGGRTLLYNYGGTFSGTGSLGPLVRLNANGTRDTTFIASAFNGGIGSIFEYPDADGTLIVTGSFTTYNGQAAPGIAVINPLGGLVTDANVGSGVLPAGTINGVTVMPGNDGPLPIFFGNFTSFNGRPANRIAIHDDMQPNLFREDFVPASVIDGPVGQVVVQEDGKFIVVGDFSGSPIYRLLPTGAVDPDFAVRGLTNIAGGNGAALRVAVGNDGSLYLYGTPISVNYGPARSVVKFSALPVPATIAVPPTGGEVSLNGSTILSVKAAGTAPFTYQWKLNGSDVPGATGSVLVLNNIQAGNLGNYSVVVSNGVGSAATSTPVAVSLGSAPTIAAHPASATVVQGGAITLSVSPAGTGPFTYQWKFNGGNIPNANDQKLVLTNIQPSQYGNYTVVVTNAFGSSADSAAGVVSAAPAPSAFVNYGNFTRPEFRRSVTPGRVTYGPVSGKIYATFVNGDYMSGVDNQRRGAVIRLNDNGSIDSSFNIGSFLNSSWAVVEQADGKVLVAGLASHESIGGENLYRVWRFNSNGILDSTYRSPVLAALPRYFGLQPDGKLLVGINSTSVNNGGVTAMLYRLNTDGTKDQSFTDPVFTANGIGVPGGVFASILVDSQNRIVIGGTFMGVNGVTRNGVARLLSDGTLDSSFVPSGYTPNANVQVRGLGLQTVGANAGKVLVAGNAFTVSSVQYQIIRLNADGSIDSTFTKQNAVALGTNTVSGARPRLLNVLSDDRFLIVSNSVTRFTADGVIDSTYTRPQLSGEAFWMETLPDGRVVLDPELGMTVNGNPVSTLVRFTDTGAVDSTFTPGQFQAEIYPEDGALLAGGKILTWGAFDTVGSTARKGAARFNADGSLDSSFNISGVSNLIGISAAAVQADGGILASTLIGNSFLSATGGLSRFDATGAVVAGFTPDASIASAVQGGDLGLFGQPDGKAVVWSQNAQRVIDGGVFVRRINGDGSLDTFNFPTTNLGAVFRDGSNNITSITTGGFRVLGQYPDGRLIAATTVAPYTAQPGTMNWTLVRLTALGAIDGTFTAPTVSGDTFSSFPTVSDTTKSPIPAAAQTLAYFTESPFRGAMPQADGSVIVFGDFTTLSGQPAPGIARLTNTGAVDNTFSVGTGAEMRSQPGRGAGVGGVTIDSQGRYWITGLFDTFGGRAAQGIVRLNPNGTVDGTFASALAFQPFIGGLTKTLLRSDNEAVVLGTFSRAGDNFPYAVNTILVPAPASFGPLPPAQILTSGQSVTLNATVQGVPAPSLQWRKNGVNISGATGSSYNIATLGTGDTGVYDVTGSNFYGSASSQGSLITVAAAGGDTFPNFAWRNPLPAGGTLRGVAYGSGKFVGVGTNGRVLSSTDGNTWNSAANIANNIILNAVAYSSALNLFIAVGSNGDVYTAPSGDVTTWTKRTSNTTDYLMGVAAGTAGVSNVLVAVSSNGRVVTSADGITWTAQLLSGNPSLTGVAGAADLFVAVGNNGALFTSTNGTSWSAATPATGLTSSSFNAVRYLNGQFVAVGNSSAAMTWTGTGSWTAVTGINRSLRDIAAIGTTYVGATDNGQIVKGTNLAGWQSVNVSPFAVHYGIATNGSVFATVGSGGEIWSSSDATAAAWTSHGSTGGFWRLSAVEFLNGKFVAVGSLGTIYTSNDGSSWKREAVSTGSWLGSAAYGAGLYIVPTLFGDILTSPDASIWTSRTVGDTVANNGVAFDNTRFVVVGDNGKIRTSTDGTNWTSVTGTGITVSLRSVAAKAGVIVAVGDSGKIYTSADGSTWVERTSNTVQNLRRVRLIEGTFFATGDSRTLLASADGITWMPLPITTSIGFSYRDIQRLSDGFYIVADQGLLVKTTDLLTATSAGNIAASETLYGLAVGAGRAVVVGEGGTLLESVLPAASATPQITVHPAGVTTDATKNVVLSVVANASGPITYQWKQGTTNVPGATSSTLLIPAAATTATGSYTVVVTSGANSVTSNAAVVTVNALAAPAITALPIGAQAVTGGASMSVTATGTAPLTYQWYRGLSGDTTNPVSTSASFTTSALNQSERYWVKITNFANQVLNSPTTTAVAITPRNGPLAGASVTGIAYSGSKYAAVAGPSILTSSDGVTWTRLTGLTGSFLAQIAYGNSTFVAVGNNGAIRTSTDDGVTWNSSTFGSTNLNGVCFDGTQFVAIGNSGVVATSTNGTTWTSRTALSGSPAMRAITFANGVYIAVGDAGAIQTSDGVYNGDTQPAWTVRASSTGNNFRSVSANGVTSAMIVAVGDNGTIRVSTNTSTSGSSWTIANSPAGNTVNAVTFANGKFIAAAGSQLFTSTDGSNWGTTTSSILPLGNLGANVIVYAGGQFLIGGYPGAIITSTTGAVDTWTLRTGGTSALFTNVIHGGGVYLAVGNNGAIGRSADGANFNVKSPAIAGLDFVTLRRAAYGKGTFVVVGDSGTIISSPDGQLWIQRASGGSAYLAATYGSNKFVVAGGGGTFASSADGTTWTPGTGTIGAANVTALTFGAGVYVAVNNVGGIYTSTDAVTWTARTSGVTTALNNVTFAGGQFVAVGAGSVVLTSPDGVTWTSRSLGTASMTLTGIAYGDGMYLATHADNANTSLLFLSADGITWNSANVGGGIVNAFGATTVAFGNGAFLITGGNALLAQTVPAADVPRITMQPASQAITGGQTVTLSVEVVGSSPTYQWYEGATGDVSTPVGTNATFTTPALAQSKRYWVRVTASGQTFDSDTAQLLGAPAIISGPTSRTVSDGSVLTLSVNAVGAAPLNYQWKYNNSNITGANGPTYTLNPVSLSNAGSYTVTVSNGAGIASTAAAVISVAPTAPTVGGISSTYGRNVPIGSNTELSVSVVGTPTLTYQWKRNGTAIPQATKSTYFITNAKPSDAGTYTVTVTNAQGNGTSADFGLSVSPELGWQWRNPLPAGNGLSSVLAVNGKFYAGGLRSTMLVSADGSTWTPRAISGTGNIFSMTYGAGRFVALGGLNAIYTSEDGNTWTPRDSKIQDSSGLQTVAFGAGRFVAVGFNGHTTTSTDGINWTPGQVPTPVANDYLYWIRFVEGKFWVSSSDDNSVRTWNSTDGLNWTQPALTLPPNTFIGQVEFGNGVYVATTEGDFLWSSDGQTWSAAGFGPLGQDMPKVRYVNDRFVAVSTDGTIATSTNGQTWTSQVSGVTVGLSDVAFANGVYVITGGLPRVILKSTDAVNWTQVVSGPAQAINLFGAATGAGKLVVVGNSGTILTSADGIAWTAPTSGVANNLIDVTYGSGLFVAVGLGGRVMTAADTALDTWTSRSSNTAANLRRVSYGNGRFLAVSDSGVSIVSTDGITWTANAATAGSFFGTAFGAGVQVAVGNNGGLFSSTDNGATWTNRAGSLINTGYSDVLFANGKFVTVGLAGVAATSADGITWTQVPAFTTDNMNGLVFTNGYWIATGSGSTYYVSTDGVTWSPRYTGAQDSLRDFVVYGSQVIGVGNNGTIIAAGAPVFFAPPVPTAARAGGNVTLSALVGGSPLPVSYQWQKDGVNISDGTGISGATTPTLTLTNLALGAAGQYRLIATNAIAPTTSAAVALTVSQAPVFTSQAANATAVATQGASFTAAAVGTPTPTYQWQKDSVNITNGTLPNGTVVAGATTGTLILTNVQPEAVGSYRLVATNTPAGESSPVSEFSLPATLTVNVLPAPSITSATPAIASGTVTLIAGNDASDDVTFTATATGTAPLSYQWRRNGLNLSNSTFVSGATTNTLTLSNVPLNGGGTITVAVTNAATAGSSPVVSAPVSLVVNPPAPVIISPLSVAGVVNTPFTYGIGVNNTTATYAATNLPAGLSINTTTGVISGVPTATGVFNTVSISATNITSTDTKTLTITINPPPPVISSPVAATGRVNQGTPLTYTIVASNTPTTITATPLPPGLTLSGNTISGTPTQAGTFSTTITATNATGSATQVVTFTIDPALNAPVYGGTTTQPGGTQNAAFNFNAAFSNVNATNGYAITAGSLPTGISLNANTGALSGTPSVVGTFQVTLTATGAGGSASVVLKITINPAPTAPVVTSPAGASGAAGEPFSYTITTDVAATSYTAVVLTGTGTEALPGWLSLSGNVLSGTPPSAGSFSLLISATGSGLTGPGKLVAVTISPSPLAPVITSSPFVSNTTTGRVGEVTTLGSPLYQLAATNSPTSFERTAVPTLESFGLQLDAASGKIFGTPTAAGTYKVWLAGVNGSGRGPSLEVTFSILPALNVPVITSNGTAAGQVGQPFSYAISATNAPTSFTDTGLPANGLSRTGNLIYGIPTTATVTPLVITVSAANADGSSVPKSVSITIAPAPATPLITSAGTASGRVGSTFTYQMTASDTPTSFNAVNLPPGLAVNPTTGVISGTPTQAGLFTATLSAANTAGLGVTAPLAFSIGAAPAAPAITSAPSATGKVGVAFTYTTTATNGPITSYAVTGTLPAGLGLNTSTGVIAGTPIEPGFKVVDLTATSANGTSLPQSLIIVVDPADNVPVITSPIYAIATVGSDFTYAIAATNMPASSPFPANVTLDAVGLPAGLAVNPSTGVIQGQPTTAGTFVATLIGTNAAGTGPSRSLTIFVQPAATAPTVTSSSTTAGQVGVGFSYQIAATNSPQGYEVLGAPAWMTVNGQSGALGGTPTIPGTFAVLLVASNSAGSSNPAPLTLVIAAAANTPVVTSTRNASGTMNATFTYNILASNTPTSYFAAGLPAGLTLNSATGAITGTPTASGTYQVTISANNANGLGQPVILTLTIAPNLQIVL